MLRIKPNFKFDRDKHPCVGEGYHYLCREGSLLRRIGHPCVIFVIYCYYIQYLTVFVTGWLDSPNWR